jgi:hypothetical protein
MVGIMGQTMNHPNGYLRYRNAEGGGQPLDAFGVPALRSSTHLDLGAGPIPGYYAWLERFVP